MCQRYRYAIATLMLIFCSSVFAEEAGTVVFALGKVSLASASGDKKALRKGEKVNQGDVIETESNGQAQIRFRDNAFVSIRSNSKFEIASYQFKGNPQEDNTSLALLKGGFRAITGEIGHRNRSQYSVKTPVATMGIRGTDFSIMLCAADCNGRDGTKPESNVNDGLYIGVAKGGVTLRNEVGKIDIDKNQYGFIAGSDRQPESLPKPPAFLMFDRTKASEEDKKAVSEAVEGKKQSKGEQKTEAKTTEKESSKQDGDSKSSAEKSENQDKSSDTQSTENNSSDETKASSADQESSTKEDDSKSSGGENATADTTSEGSTNASDAATSNTESNADTPSQTESVSSSSAVAIDSTSSEVGSSVTDSSFGFIESGDSLSLAGAPSSTFGDTGSAVTSLPIGVPFLPVDTIKPLEPVATKYIYIPVDASNTSHRVTIMSTSHQALFAGSPIVVNDTVTPKTYGTASGLTGVFLTAANASAAGDYNYAVSSGTASNLDFGYDPATGLSWGRWANGVTDSTLLNYVDSATTHETLNQDGVHWILGQQDSSVTTLPTTGSATYVLFGNTQPTDSQGHVGVLGAASMSANFTNLTVDTSINVAINNQTWSASATGLPINSNASFGGNLAVTVNTDTNPVSGTGILKGAFVGPATANGAPLGAGVGYSLDASPNGVANHVSGAAIFKVPQ